MPRSLTANASAQKSLAAGASPRIVIRIDWAGAIGTKFYSDHDLNTPLTAEGRILNSADIELSLSERGIHAVSDVSVTLSDHDGVLAGYCAQTPLALKRATVYQHFIGNGLDDMVPLLVGYVDDPVSWKEDGASLSFDITDLMTGHNVTVEHVASVEDFETIVGQSDGAALPLVFGRVKELKCVQVSGGLRGQLMRDIWSSTQVMYIEGGEDFPQDQVITITICAEEIEGVMRGRAFTITDRTPRYTVIFAGATVRLKGDNQVYVANDARSLAVHKVFGLRNFKLKSGATGTRDVEQLVEVPSHLYTVNLNDTATFPSLGRPLTTITFSTALTDIQGDDWASDDVWVELSGYTRDGSSLVENPADVIRYLLQDFGDVPSSRIDGTTFSAAATSLQYHKFAFALSGQRDLKELAADLAMQAQCQLLVIAAKVYLFFVSDNPGASQMDFGNSVVAEDSAERTWLPVEEIWSEVAVSYAPDLSGRAEQREKRFTLKDATAETSWGRRGEELSLWAYRNLSMAKSIAQHYLNHHARVWQKASMKTYLDGLDLLPLDWVTVGNLPWWSAGQLARIEAARLSSGDAGGGQPDAIEFDLFVPVAPGCAGTCEVACQNAGCEGASEHTGGGGCETACEMSCQEACQLVCVTTCQAACQTACQLACETSEEQPEPEYEFQITAPENVERDVAFNITIQSRVVDPAGDDTAYTPDGNVSITLLYAGDDVIAPVTTDQTGWVDGAKTVSCTISGGTEAREIVIHVEDTDTGRIGEATVIVAEAGETGFLVTAPATVTRNATFDLEIQSIYLASGADDTAFTPAGNVDIEENFPADAISPALTDNTGWVDGAKTVSCSLTGGTEGISGRITVTDPDSGRTGHADVAIEEPQYGFELTAPSNVERGVAFNLTIQSILLATGADDTGFTPTGNVGIADDASGDDVSPSTTDNTGWSSGAKTVSVTLSGGSGADVVRLTATDPDTGRVGYVVVTVAGAADMGFELTAPAQVTRYKTFDLNVQSIYLSSGSDDTAYTPSGDVAITDTEDTHSPESTDNTGWSNGGKDVSSILAAPSTGTGTIVTATDAAGGRTGKVLLRAEGEDAPPGWDEGGGEFEVIDPDYGFRVTAPETVSRGVAFDLDIQSILLSDESDDTAYTPTGNVQIFTDSETDLADPTYTDNTGWTDGAKTVSVTLDGGSGDANLAVYVHDMDTGRIGYAEIAVATGFAFEVTAPGQVDPDEEFSVTIQSIRADTAEDDTTYVPATSVSLTDDSATFDVTPVSLNDIGWVDGAKTVTCKFSGAGSLDTARLTATDDEDGRTGYADIDIGLDYQFEITAPGSVSRDTPFDITIQSVRISTGEDDTTFVPDGDVTLSDECSTSGDDLLPAYTSNTGWVDGAKTVTCTIDGGSGTGTCVLTVTDPSSGRTGSVDIGIQATSMSEDTTYTYVLKKEWSGTGDPRPVDQTDFDTLLANAEAQAVTRQKSTYGDAGYLYLSYYYSYGWKRNARIYRGAAVFNTNGQPASAKYYLKFNVEDIYLRAEDPGQYDYKFYKFADQDQRGIYVAKGTWAGDDAQESDWDSYESAIFVPFEELTHREPSVNGQTSYSAVTVGESSYVEIPASWINTSGLTKIMCFWRTDPNPIRPGDHYSLPTNIYGYYGDAAFPMNIDKLCVGGKV